MQTGHYIYVSRSTAFDVKVVHQLHVMLEVGLTSGAGTAAGKDKNNAKSTVDRAHWWR